MATSVSTTGMQGRAVAEWDPEPVKNDVKEVADVGIAAVAASSATSIKKLSDHCFGEGVLSTTAAVIVTNKVKTVAKKHTDASVDDCFATNDTLCSRAAQWGGY